MDGIKELEEQQARQHAIRAQIASQPAPRKDFQQTIYKHPNNPIPQSLKEAAGITVAVIIVFAIVLLLA